jgi:hypothetical protein
MFLFYLFVMFLSFVEAVSIVMHQLLTLSICVWGGAGIWGWIVYQAIGYAWGGFYLATGKKEIFVSFEFGLCWRFFVLLFVLFSMNHLFFVLNYVVLVFFSFSFCGVQHESSFLF